MAFVQYAGKRRNEIIRCACRSREKPVAVWFNIKVEMITSCHSHQY